MTESETERPMRERAARAMLAKLHAENGAWAFAQGDDPTCVMLDGTFDLGDLVDAVLAEIERPSEGMIQAATDAYEEWCLDEDTFSVAKLAELMLAATIRAAREGK